MQPEQIKVRGTIYSPKAAGNLRRWVKGGFNLHLPLWRYDFINTGEIPVPESRIKLSDLLERIRIYYEQPLILSVINYIEKHDPTVEGELDEFREKILAGKKVKRSEALHGMIFLEDIVPEGQGDYVLQLGS